MYSQKKRNKGRAEGTWEIWMLGGSRWHERSKVRLKGRKEGEKIRKGGEVEEKRSHVPLLQHKSPEEAYHGTSCRIGLLIRQSAHIRTHKHTHTVWIGPLPPFSQSDSVADGENSRRNTNEWNQWVRPLCMYLYAYLFLYECVWLHYSNKQEWRLKYLHVIPKIWSKQLYME